MMGDGMLPYILIFVFSVFLSSVSQMLLKKSTKKKYSSVIKEYMNIYVISGYSIFVIVTLINIYAFRYIPVSFGGALESLGYLFVAGLDYLIFHERISRRKMLGLLIIVSGVIIVCI